MLDSNAIFTLIGKLDNIRNERDHEMVGYYQKVFSTPEGEIVLVDLMMRFGEFKPSFNKMETGQHSVLIYIKNRLLGISEQPPTGEQQ